MKRNTLLTLCAITALGATTALGIVKATPVEPASATTLACDTRTWKSTSSTDFSLNTNWNPENVPDTAGEKALIPNTAGLANPGLTKNVTLGALEIQNSYTVSTNGYTLTITADGDCDGILTIANGATLDIGAGGVVDLASAVTHDIEGDLTLSTSTSDLKVSANVTLAVGGFATAGSVNGQDNNAQIRIAPSKTLTNLIEIRGKLTLMNDAATAGTFKNGRTGVVRADVVGYLVFAADLTLDDDSGAKWKAKTNSGAVLVFRESATGLEGNFFLDDCAKIELPVANTTITTSGDLTSDPSGAYSGTVDASSSGSCFNYAGPSSICNSTTSGDCT